MNKQFTLISKCSAYEELIKIKALPGSSEATLASIFDKVKKEFNDVKADLLNIEKVIKSDIAAEIKQAEALESKSKSSDRKVRNSYKKLIKVRSRAYDTEGNLRALLEQKRGVLQISNEVDNINELLKKILVDIDEIDSNLPVTDQLFNANSINREHYPLLFKLLSQAHPEKFEQITNLTPSSATSEPSSEILQYASTEQQSATRTIVPSMHSTKKVKPTFILSSLRKIEPSTAISFETVTATDKISIKSLRESN
ncbi:hypothetical protein KAFR_0L00630 [Kazachstania africana CBS 2517]|uniref:Uncharacterized protein n=1 Tax=Kazachstania africana (strain ATCC 22294 / BCRC 22015 / CBS 2517 / CECT 1963 / NBRC 1671 / NRRL Y-8276) TaxID=1071382 RepID=H2B220_KAZAF|nr:hypothetical protein KAFR_0L00630 [Kazachstania africana CBS 2517]CCF60670.1 hypothetical protein KAFR_0L00630 [Kazachstania africana CBS 2517]